MVRHPETSNRRQLLPALDPREREGPETKDTRLSIFLPSYLLKAAAWV